MAAESFLQRARKIGIIAFVSGLFVGFFPFASGTFGSLVGLLLVYGMGGWHWGATLAAAVILTGLGAWACREARSWIEGEDSSVFVIDEIVGMLFAMIAIPLTGPNVVTGFFLFRLFDIVKPFPASFFDRRVKNGWGVMLDDVTAGIYTNILLHLIQRTHL